jgi:TPR repeat protein
MGYIKATYNLGIILMAKNQKDDGYRYLYNAYKSGHIKATNRIGELLFYGEYLKRDYKRAIYYFEEAAKKGYVQAECNLAFAYAKGAGVFKNFGRAHQFAKKGRKLGYKLCQKVWVDYNLHKYPEDKSFKFGFYKPIE